ncbi:HCOMODA/2-hydroxy-3-carboxy-muconic semialdehyde decarboxylase [Paraburkholderia sp. BL23I1N1]|uniref:class II aldolase/adducin family protein n=1 Tax=Paraburkholderia sp. BL23I1N1 TaxID=1938802 RepID=UPI000FF36A4D|nr:class II aldolase/adducin family protein [Paraburkholderia sp. BL23I1N1]RKE38638.1 HCOMODA/2-hydroxy-3-carboxy-muconic semialdehyde decarboxylase [Paraburkholderia sp. BL23I1N1]
MVTKVSPAMGRQLRIAARALARHGLAHAYGHCSTRLDDAHFLVCAARPMGLIKAGEPGVVVPVDGPLPTGVLGEVRLHQQIYRRRPQVQAVARSMPPALMALGTARRTPRPRHGMGAYFGRGTALWDDPQLVRDDERAAGVIDALDDRDAVVMRGNGVVVAGDSLAKVVALTWYLEDAARLELKILAAGLEDCSVVLDEAECAMRATEAGGIFERMWDYLSAGDPELDIQD